MNEENCTEQYKGLIMLRKGEVNDGNIWFATVGHRMVSDGVYKTKEELIKSLEDLNLDTVCKIISGAIGRVIEITKEEKK